jgi:hypothetical protein
VPSQPDASLKKMKTRMIQVQTRFRILTLVFVLFSLLGLRAGTPYFSEVRVANIDDRDEDEFARAFDVEFDVDSLEAARFFVKAYAGGQLLVTSDTFDVSGSPYDFHTARVLCDSFQSVLSHRVIDLTVELYDGNSGSKLQTWTKVESPGLGGIQVELSSEDLAVVPPDIIDVNLVEYSGSDPWRQLLYGVNLSATEALSFHTTKDTAKYPRESSVFLGKVYRFTIPHGAKALRVRAPEDVYLTLAKEVIPGPAQVLPGKASQTAKNKDTRNTVVIAGPKGIDAGVYLVHAVMLNPHPVFPRAIEPGDLEIDCFMAGSWDWAQVGIERILTGVEHGSGAPLPSDGRAFTLISHGRVDSPRGMVELGNAAGSKWGRSSYYVNWSEGSHWNNGVLPEDKSLAGSRFIAVASRAAGRIITSAGYTTLSSCDFLGHSWGTWLGYNLRSGNGFTGNYARFFALDPAKHVPLVSKNPPKRGFARVAQYSVGIYGNGLYGSGPFTTTCHDAVRLEPPEESENLPRHSEPVNVATAILNDTAPAFVRESFAFAFSSSATPSQRVWQSNRYDGFEVVLYTDGNGLVREERYYSALTPNFGMEVIRSAAP